MNNWNYIVAGMSFVLLAFLLWKEFQRTNRARLRWRLFATVIAVSSLALMYLPATYNRSVILNSNFPLVLLTHGFNADSVYGFRLDHANAVTITFDDQLTSARKQQAALVTNIDADPLIRNTEHPVHIFGYGPEPEQLKKLDGRSLIYHAPQPPTGTISVYWKSTKSAGEKLDVQGTFNNMEQQPVTMLLSGYGTTLDSLSIGPGEKRQFELSAVLKHTGRSLFSLVVKSGRDTIENQPVPVLVEEPKPMHVLMLASSPDFENKFLKGWLVQKGHQVTSRTLISKNRISSGFLNTPVMPLDNITLSMLNRFDLCITDATSLAAISRTELAGINAAVTQKSMGLIIRSDTNVATSFYAHRFPVSQANHGSQLRLGLVDTAVKFKPLVVDEAFFIRSTTGTQPLVTDNQNRIFSSSTLHGTGKIIVSTVASSFQWALAGNNTDYDRFWTELLKKAAAKQPSQEAWRVSPALPRVNEPVTIHTETNLETAPRSNVMGASVYLKHDAALPFRWTGTYWPVKPGWHPTIQTNGSFFWWYVYSQNDWEAVYAYNRIRETKLFAEKSKGPPLNNSNLIRREKAELPKVLFFFLFILSSAFLWVENKMYG